MKIEIDHSSGRSGYYSQWKVGRIIDHVGARKRRSNIAIVQGLEAENPKRVILGAGNANSIDDLMCGKFQRDRLSVVRQINDVSEDQLIVLPQDYRIGGWDAQRSISYDQKTVVRLDSMATKKQLLEYKAEQDENNDKFRSGFSFSEMVQWDMTPERMLAAAAASIKNDDAERTRSCYAWKSPSDNGLRVVSLLRAIEGLEIRLIQDFASWKILPAILETRGGKKAEQKLRHINGYMKFFEADKFLDKLDVNELDMIEKMSRPHDSRRGWHMDVPSRGDRNERHEIKISNMPISKYQADGMFDMKHCYSLVVTDHGDTEQRYREGRRRSPRWQDAPSKQDVFYTANAIAALHSVRKIHRNRPAGWRCGNLPIAMPKESFVEYADALRYQTVILDKKGRSNKWSLRSLNKSEIEDWLWSAVQLYGASETMTTIPGALNPRGVTRMIKMYEGRQRVNAL